MAEYYKFITGLGGGKPSPDYSVTVEFAFTLTYNNKVYYLNEDGAWRAGEAYFRYTIKLNESVRKKVEIAGFASDGYFSMQFRQTMEGWNSDTGTYRQSCRFDNFTLTMESPELYEEALTTEVKVNPANNLEMNIELPIADVADLPNNTLLYALYFTNSNNAPTSQWHTKGKADQRTLIAHIVACALRYGEHHSRRIQAQMFTGKHVDMNTVMQDDKYLRTGFYVNSLELDCLSDEYDGELVEMPGVIDPFN